MSASNVSRRRLTALGRDERIELAIKRLERLARLEGEYVAQLNDAGLRLLRTSMFSAYCDCRDLGVADRAESLLAVSRVTPSEPSPVVVRETAKLAG